MSPYGNFNEHAQEVWNFVRCQRPDGTAYGTAGTCRKGVQAEKEVEEKKKGRQGPSRSDLSEYWQERANSAEVRYDKKLQRSTTIHTGESPPALVQKMKPYTTLSGDEKASIHMYGAAGNKEQIFDAMNMKLRTGQEPPDEKREAVEFTIQNLKTALNKLPDVKGEFYRAVSKGGARAIQGLSLGTIIEDRGFGSYSDEGGPNISPFIDRKSKDNIVMVVQGKRMKNVSPVMPYQEGEHLSAPGTKLRLTRIEEKGTWTQKINDYVPTYYFEEV